MKLCTTKQLIGQHWRILPLVMFTENSCDLQHYSGAKRDVVTVCLFRSCSVSHRSNRRHFNELSFSSSHRLIDGWRTSRRRQQPVMWNVLPRFLRPWRSCIGQNCDGACGRGKGIDHRFAATTVVWTQPLLRFWRSSITVWRFVSELLGPKS